MTGHNFKITIYIPSHNYARYLSQSVESVITQSFNDWFLYIIDEGSTDDTLIIAKRFQESHPDKIKVIHNKEPLGLQKVANKVLSLSNSKYMMRLDADDWLDENALSCMINKLEKNQNAGIVFSGYFYTNEEGAIIGTETKHSLDNNDLSNYAPPHGACTMFRTRALKAAGGYLENVNAQDGWDLWYKLMRKIQAEVITIPLFYYRQHNSSLSKDNSRLLKARELIFENISQSSKGDYVPQVAAVLPIKENYDFISEIPFKKFGGKTLIENAIDSIEQCNQVTDLIVTSASEKVINFIDKLDFRGSKNNFILHKRDNENHQPGNIKIKKFFDIANDEFYKKHETYPDIILYLSLHAVLRKASHIEQAINLLKISESDSVVSVSSENEALFQYGLKGLEILNPGRFQDLAFEREKLFRFNGALIAVWSEIIKSENLLGSKINFIEMSPDESLQINTPVLSKLLD
jgi:glycosyltransferase involved in cell wall biosynthesis